MSDSSQNKQKDNWIAWIFIIGATAATAYWKYRQGKRQLDKKPDDEFVFIPLDSVQIPQNLYFKVYMPNGEILDLAFSVEEWSMVLSLLDMTGETLDKVLFDIATERRAAGLI